MKHALTILATVFLCAAHGVTLPWRVDVQRAQPVALAAYHGETVTLAPVFTQNGAAVSNLAFETCWQTNGMGNAWWVFPGLTFAPSNDVGAASYLFFVRARTSDGVNYRANGTLRMLPSPGFEPNTLPLPAVSVAGLEDAVTNSAALADWVRALSPPAPDCGFNLDAYNAAIGNLEHAVGNLTDETRRLASTDTDLSGRITGLSARVTTAEGAVARVHNENLDIDAKVNRIYTFMQGSNVWFEVTNYQRTVTGVIPELSLVETRDGVELKLWSSTEQIEAAKREAVEIATNHTNRALEHVPDRAWGLYTSGTGAEAPEGFTWISTPRVAIAGALEYTKYVTSGGAVWLLESNGLAVSPGADTNGYFRIAGDDGEPIIEITKSASYTIGAHADNVTMVDGALVVTYNITSETHPIVYTCSDLTARDWRAEDDPQNLFSVTWSGQSGAWVCTVEPRGPLVRGFVKAESAVAGGTLVRMNGKSVSTGGIQCTDGIHYVRPVYNGGNITWEVVQ